MIRIDKLLLSRQSGYTPLHTAAKCGNVRAVRLLMQRDVNPDVDGKDGLKPLHVAAQNNQSKVALLLLEKGASLDSTTQVSLDFH